MNDDHPKTYKSVEAALAALKPDALEQAAEAAKESERKRDAALARCLASPDDVPTPEDVDAIRHVFIRLADETKREPILRLLGCWQRLSGNAFDITSIVANPGGGHYDLWGAVGIWAKTYRLTASPDGVGSQNEADPAEDDTTAKPPAKRGKGKRSATINARMVDAYQKKPHEVLGWSARDWATHLGCAVSTIAGTEMWKELTGLQDEAKQDKTSRERKRQHGK